jgi:DNA-binding MarR family transcriptional regulator
MATTYAAAPHLASRLRLAVARTARRLRQEAGGGLSPTLTAALASIENHGPMTPSELADRERVKRPTATRLIGNLEENGYVTRTSDPSDRRSSLIAVTPEGRELMRTLRTRKDAYLAQRLRKLSAEERGTLDRAADLLERLLEEDPA